jgi:hypothetical protein
MEEQISQTSKDRADLVKRLFAVSLSVGFAQIAKVVDISIITLQDLLMLVVSAVVVVLSWEGYLRVLRDFPLKDAVRFYLDITIVFVYLILLEFSHVTKIGWWYIVIDIIFVLYIVWDICMNWAYRRGVCGLSPTISWFIYLFSITKFAYFASHQHFYITIGFILYGIVVYRFDRIHNYRWGLKGLCVIVPIGVYLLLTRMILA